MLAAFMVDTALFHQLRSRGRSVAQGLLLVLLATWLAAVCPHCLAQAEAAAPVDGVGESMHCHGADASAPADPVGSDAFDYDACAQPPACAGSDCAQLTAIEPGAPLEVLVAEVSSPAFVAADFLSFAYPSTPPPAAVDLPVLAVAGCPLYLRHCTFLN